jgi:hypothetical protein
VGSERWKHRSSGYEVRVSWYGLMRSDISGGTAGVGHAKRSKTAQATQRPEDNLLFVGFTAAICTCTTASSPFSLASLPSELLFQRSCR